MEHIPWVEKYRPTKFEDIVLEDNNRKILDNIIRDNKFPNLLFYGPPGTGKTTTIINLIQKYQEKYNQKRKGLKIHLNASDDRGIDIIRNQISQFVTTKILFGTGIKFIILDEVDYMTKNAQQALRYLIQQYHNNIRFCLICNYISRIDSALQNEFIRLRFCNLPRDGITKFLKRIIADEKIDISDNQLFAVQKTFKSDIRSMINFLQSNHNSPSPFYEIITNEFWDDIIQTIAHDDDYNKIYYEIEINCEKYNIEKINFLKELINYIIKERTGLLTPRMMKLFTFVIHSININFDYLIHFFLRRFKLLFLMHCE